MAEIVLYGFGEAGQAIALGLQGNDCAAFDLSLDRSAVEKLAVRAANSPKDAVSDVRAIFCLVTADQALDAAKAAAPHLPDGALWFDGNSCAPQTKRKVADVIVAAGGRYVDTAIMAPIHPRLHRTPMLLSGPHAADAQSLTDQLGMDAKVVSDEVGQASAIKMLRSVIVKGIEALTAESLLAARASGVEDAVIASLNASPPIDDWGARGSYNLERMASHGARRAAEMDEVVETLKALGLPDRMSAATRDWQRQISEMKCNLDEDGFASRADALLKRIGPIQKKT